MIMRLILLLPVLISLAGCIGPSETSVSQALTTNETQRIIFEKQSDAFATIIRASTMDEDKREQILEAISQDRDAFYRVNRSVGGFISALSELSPEEVDRILNDALDLYLRVKGQAEAADR